MTNAELIAKIREEIEQRIHDISHPLKDGYEIQSIGKIEGLSELLDFLATLEEQTKEVRNPIFDECLAKVDQKVREEVRENIDFEQALYDHFGQVKDFTLGMRIGKYFYELGCTRTAEKYDEIEYNRQRAEECVPNDLEEAAIKYQESVPVDTTIHYCGADEDVYFANRLVDAVIFGAKWQAEQLLKSSPLPEDTVLFNKGVAEGRRLAGEEQADLFTIVALDAAQRAKSQMLKEAVEGEVSAVILRENRDEVHYAVTYPEGESLHSITDKVHIIIVKEDEK